LSFFMFYPAWIVVFNGVLFMIDQNRYFLVASWLILTAQFYYLRAFSEVVASERPVSFDPLVCGATRYAVPDALFVTIISYTCIVGVGLYRDGKRFGIQNSIVTYGTPVLYVAATVYTEYLTAAQLAINLAISAITVGSFIVVYQFIITEP